MDLYLIAWVMGALPTWWVLSRGELRATPAEFYYACILLWPLIWVVCSVAGLLLLGMKLIALCRGGNRK